MTIDRPSLTALGVAVHRAVHQVEENGSLFRDPFARLVLGPDADALMATHARPEDTRMRLHVAMRTRFAEDALAAAVADGVAQAVVLGAGLDTFALRNPWPCLNVFEVDRPVTQNWKLDCIRRAGLSFPANARFVAMDFEHDEVAGRLEPQGFDRARPAFFIWLGVVPYLTREAIMTTLAFAGSLPGNEIVCDYSEPLENYPADQRQARAEIARRVAAVGEPWLSFFEPAELAALLRQQGFDDIQDLGPRQIARRYFNRDMPESGGAHVLHARRLARPLSGGGHPS